MRGPKLTGNAFANILVILAIAFIPLMYGGLLSSAYQSPIEHLDHLRAAVVNEDQPATANLISGQRQTLDVGEMLVDTLTDPAPGQDVGFTWEELGRADAEAQLADGTLAAILYVPRSLSADVIQIGTSAAPNARPAQLELVTDDGVNYLTGTMARTVATALEDEIRATASKTYVDAILGSFGTIRQGMVSAADGADQLNTGADQLDRGLGELNSKIPSLSDGASQLSSGAEQLAGGANSLNSGLDAYTAGVDQAAAGANTLRGKTGQLQSGIEQLRAGSAQVAAGNKKLDDGFHQISDPVSELAPLPDELLKLVQDTAANLDELSAQCQQDYPGSDLCLFLEDLQSHQGEITAKAGEIADQANEAIGAVGQLQGSLDQLADGSAQLESGLTTLQTQVGSTSDGAANQTLIGGINALSSGLDQLSANSEQLRAGGGQLSDGSRQLAAGTSELNSQVPTLAAGVGQLDEGAGRLHDGTEQLAGALAEGSDQVPDYNHQDQDSIASTVSQLVGVEPIRANPVANNGAGFSPMFLSLALWVGAIAIFLVLPALDRGVRPGEHWALQAIRPGSTAALMAMIQAVIAVVLTNFSVQMEAKDLAGFVLVAVLASLTFAVINQACIAVLAYRGRFVSIVLLVLQITSMGATFPVETMPAFFQWIHPWLPMTYTQLSFRALIAGAGVPNIVWHTVGVLLLWWVVAVLVILWAAHHRYQKRPLPYDQALLPDNYPLDEDASPEELARRRDLKTEVFADWRAARHAVEGRFIMDRQRRGATTAVLEPSAPDEPNSDPEAPAADEGDSPTPTDQG
ncbi:YhgE/Pip domain-containing protein [Scrofimicrobium sp. R131]|uniref:YhgE/Pip domain-containing protein n=1 Tax=Scrofimicrobium appendicitidis TaxID=3079930 RepID=A0AAU7V693_9ACTO